MTGRITNRFEIPWESIAIFLFSLVVSGAVWAEENQQELTCILKNTPVSCPERNQTLFGYFISSVLGLPVGLPTVFSVLGILISICVALSGWRLRREIDEITGSVGAYRDAIFNGLALAGSDALRILHYKELEGALLNTTAADTANAPRNILLNNKTIQTILKSLRDRGEKHLETAGHDAGKDFGQVVVDLQKDRLGNLDVLIEEWFRYDSNAGFGNFSKDSYLRPGPHNTIKIRLKYNFLTTGRNFKDASNSLCAFMRGYIHGVISSLPSETLKEFGFSPEGIVVVHDSRTSDCICTSKQESRGCIFTVIEQS